MPDSKLHERNGTDNQFAGQAVPGFWLPRHIQAQILNGEGVHYAKLSYCSGRPCQPDDPGAITSYYPVLIISQWQKLLSLLRQNRNQPGFRFPTGQAYWQRLQAALQILGQNFADLDYAPRQQALRSLPGYTGYSQQMIALTTQALDLFSLDQMPAAFAQHFTWQIARRWEVMTGLPGQVRFYPAHRWQGWLHSLPGLINRPLFRNGDSAERVPEVVLGYAAGNVPGAALLIAFLAQATTLAGNAPPPAVIVKNSRSEPIFTPLVLDAIQEIDPELVANLVVLIWDYDDPSVQGWLLSQADLVIAAASDETITQLQAQIRTVPRIENKPGKERGDSPAARSTQRLRFHAHGHKVSFSAISRQVLARDLADPDTGTALLDIVSLLASLDSVIWDQHGCLSARLHFVEQGTGDCFTADDYADRLKDQLRRLAAFLPRGTWPLQQIHDRFDRYKQLESTGQVQVFSSYHDPFLVVLDSRVMDPALGTRALSSLVNDCQGRVIIVRPVADLMEVPNQILRMMPAANLQSLSLAAGSPGQTVDRKLLEFATACGKRGVTAIRTVGRAAFPQLSYSWDGFIPLDLLSRRPAGHFCTIEFDQPYDQILATYHLFAQRQ